MLPPPPGAAEVVNNLETYKAATGVYPSRLDSLIDTTGAVYSKAYAGVAEMTTIDNGSSSAVNYFLENGGGITQVMQHSAATTDPNASTDGVNPTALSMAASDSAIQMSTAASSP